MSVPCPFQSSKFGEADYSRRAESAGGYTYHRLVPERLAAIADALGQLAAQAQLAVAAKRPCG